MNWFGFNSDGRLVCKPGNLLDQRYRVIEDPISGGNGNVYLCRDLELKRSVVVKPYSANSTCHFEGEREAKLVQIANQLDPAGDFFVQYFSSFFHKCHFCIVIEQYGMSLYDAQQARQ
jgi:hypothetical protein